MLRNHTKVTFAGNKDHQNGTCNNKHLPWQQQNRRIVQYICITVIVNNESCANPQFPDEYLCG